MPKRNRKIQYSRKNMSYKQTDQSSGGPQGSDIDDMPPSKRPTPPRGQAGESAPGQDNMMGVDDELAGLSLSDRTTDMPATLATTSMTGASIHGEGINFNESSSGMSNHSGLTQVAKKAYAPRTNKVVHAAPPGLNVLGKPVKKDSTEANLWILNQSDSPLLKLPGEIRNRIYDFVFPANKTILIGYTTYETTKVDDAHKVDRISKYWCKVLGEHDNPFTEKNLKKDTGSMTLLSGVSRQLYLETVRFPYKLNRVAFESNLTMHNFLTGTKLAAQAPLTTIERLVVKDTLPGLNLIDAMDKIETVRVSIGRYTGQYVVRKDQDGKKQLRRGD